MIPLVLAAWVTSDSSLPPNARAEAAHAEAEAFDALHLHHDCDAAAAFRRAFDISHDERLLLNAGLAFERAGDSDAARQAFSAIEDASVAARAADHMRALGPTRKRCPAPVVTAAPPPLDAPADRAAPPAPPAPRETSTTPPTTATTQKTAGATATTTLGATTTPTMGATTSTTMGAATGATMEAPATTAPGAVSWPLFGVGAAALGTGVLIGGGTATGAVLSSGVLSDSNSSGADKQSAMNAQPLLLAGAIVAGVLVAGGAALVPWALLPGDG